MIKYRVTVDIERLCEREIERAIKRIGVDKDTEFIVEPPTPTQWTIHGAGTVYSASNNTLAEPKSPVKITFIWTEDDIVVDNIGDYFEK